MKSKHLTVTMWMACGLLVGLLSSHANAQKAEKYAEAAKATESCMSIPEFFGDLRSPCQKQQGLVHEWCDGRQGPVSCPDDKAQEWEKDLAQARRQVADLGRKKEELQSSLSKASTDAEKNSIKAILDTTSTEWNKAEEMRKDRISKLDQRYVQTEATIEKCIDYRRAYMNIYSDLITRLKAETDEKSKPFAQTILDRQYKEISGHETQITARKNAIGSCRDARGRLR